MSSDGRRLIESAGRSHVLVSFPYDEDLVQLMRDLGLSRFWGVDPKGYHVPVDFMTDQVLKTLRRRGFEAT